MTQTLTTSRGAVTVRQAQTVDAAVLRELRLEALAAHPEAFAADYGATADEPSAKWSRLIDDYAAGNSGVLCVATADERLIGMLGLVRGHWPKTWHAGTLWGAYVQPDWRGLCIAEALIEECAGWARIHGLTIIKLAVVTTNTPAIRCYTRCGLTAYGVDPQVLRYKGATYDELLMAKTL